MSLLPDVATAGLYALGLFLVILGFLVVFVETVRPSRLVALLTGSLVLAVALALAGEVALALLPAGFGGAFLANHLFEWLTKL